MLRSSRVAHRTYLRRICKQARCLVYELARRIVRHELEAFCGVTAYMTSVIHSGEISFLNTILSSFCVRSYEGFARSYVPSALLHVQFRSCSIVLSLGYTAHCAVDAYLVSPMAPTPTTLFSLSITPVFEAHPTRERLSFLDEGFRPCILITLQGFFRRVCCVSRRLFSIRVRRNIIIVWVFKCLLKVINS